ncbi:10808_t:CDS:10, partial [Gigaspora margarita]
FSKASELLFSKSEVYNKVKDDESRAESDDEANSDETADEIKSNNEMTSEEDEEKNETKTMKNCIIKSKCNILNTIKLKKTRREIAQHFGFAVTTKSSDDHHFHLKCKRGSQPRNCSNLTADTRQRKRMSKRCGCPYLLKAVLRNCKWKVIEIIDEHNHSMAKDERVFHKHWQLTRETRHTVVSRSKAKDENGAPTVSKKDISNIGLRINSSEETASMEALIVEMDERAYTVHQVVLIDATYKANVYMLPFINIIGISNLGVNKLQTFGIAGASLIFLDIFPFVFVTDNDAALIGALRKIFPKKNLRKYFDDDSFDEIIKIIECFINLRDYNELNFAISDYHKLATSNSNTDEVIKYLESKLMHFGAITTQHAEVTLASEETSLKYENESIGIDPLLAQNDKDHLRPLLGRVSQFALNKIKCELLNATMYEACLCELHVTYNLPCRHLLPIKDEQQKSSLLDKLDDILAIPEVKLSDIKVPERKKKVNHGTNQIKSTITSQKKKSKNVETKLTKCTSFSQSILALHIEDKEQNLRLNYRIPPEDIDQVYNPLSDGNCGFRALAIAIRGNKENWDLIKLVMNGQLNKRMEVYRDWLGYDINLLKRILESRYLSCQPSLWFLSPDCAQLAANTFSVPIAIFEESDDH